MNKVRKLSRLGNELHLAASMALLDLTGGKYDQAVIALLVLSRCVDDWLTEGVIRPPKRLSRSISIRAVASSLREPHTTVQRHAQKLRNGGLLVENGRGYAISNDPVHAAAVVKLLRQAHDSMIGLVEDFASAVRVVGPVQALEPGLMTAITAAALDIWLIPFEAAREPVVDWTSKLIWITIAVANVRHVTTDPVLSDLYADHPTPDALRRPIDVRAIAAITRLSYGTVYRHCRKLADINVIRYDRRGWLIAAGQFQKGRVDQGVRALLAYYSKRINELVALGLDPEHVAERYFDMRSAYAPLWMSSQDVRA